MAKKQKTQADYEHEWAAEDARRASQFQGPTRLPASAFRVAIPRTREDFAVPSRVRAPEENTSPGELAAVLASAARNAPQGVGRLLSSLGDMGKFAGEQALLSVKDRFTGGDEAYQHLANSPGIRNFVANFAEHPASAAADFLPLVGAAKGPGEMARQAVLARRHGDIQGAEQLESALIPLAVLGMLPEGSALARGAERSALREGAENAAERSLAARLERAKAQEKSLAVATASKPRAKKAAAVARAPANPLQVVAVEYGRDIARRLDGMIDPSAPVSEWRAAADRLKSADLAVNNMQQAPSPFSVRPAEVATDPRIENRKGELGKIANLELHVAPRVTDPQPPVSIFDKEGHGYVMSMSDLSAAGDDLLGINDVMFRNPFSRRGGQGYMFDNPGEVWAADETPAAEHVALAEQLQRETGKPTMLLPWTMGPLSIDFSHQPRGAQYMYADAAMDAADRNALASDIKAVLPDWRGFEDPEGVDMFMGATGKARGALNKLMDRYRDRGGLGIGAARYATTDLSQIGTPMTTLRNVGIIDPRFGIHPSSHNSYRFGVPGEGEGVLAEPDIGALALAPDIMEALGYKTPFDFPVGVQPGTKSPLRSMQLKPKAGILDYKTLRYLDDLRAGSGG